MMIQEIHIVIRLVSSQENEFDRTFDRTWRNEENERIQRNRKNANVFFESISHQNHAVSLIQQTLELIPRTEAFELERLHFINEMR